MILKNSLYSKTKSRLKHTLTQDQEDTLEKLDAFITESNSRIFLLNGYAGTGKTFLISELIKTLNSINRNTVQLAPTGKASKVFSFFSRFPSFTIHKYIYHISNEHEGFTNVSVKKNTLKNTCFFVDEASMIGVYSSKNGNSLLEDLINFVLQGNESNKLIFIGDNAQLPPIGQDYSPAIDKDFIDSNYNYPCIASSLKEITRQATNSSIIINATEIRNRIQQENFAFKFIKNIDTIQSFLITGNELKDEIETCYDKYGIANTIVLCRSNKQANLYNQHIRSSILWYEENLEVGDLLMVVKNNYWLKDKIKKMNFIANGDNIKIEQVYGQEKKYGFSFTNALVSFPDYPNQEAIATKLLTDTLLSETPSLTPESFRKLYQSLQIEYAYEKNKTKRNELIRNNPYYQALQVKFSYAITGHKSQGGQWDAVFVEKGFLSERNMDKNYLRWIYTAITRSKKKLYFVNFTSAFYHSN